MSTKDLLALLEAAHDSYGAVNSKDIDEALYVLRSRAYGKKVGTEESAKLTEAITSSDIGRSLIGRTAHFLGKKGTITESGLMWWLVARAHQTSPEQALRNLSSFVALDEFSCNAVMVLANVSTAEEVQLDNDVSLVPLTQIPDSAQKTEMSDEVAARATYSYAGLPRAALLKRYKYPKSLLNDGEDPTHDGRELLSLAATELDEARLCVAVSGPASPQMTYFWIAPEASVPFYRLGDHMHRYALRGSLYAGEGFRAEWNAKEVHAQFRRLDSPKRENLSIPMTYLANAYGAERMVDVAINLGIAAESLFLHDITGGGELKFRLSHRAARLLATAEAERQEIYKTFQKVYDLRSKAVHRGNLAPNPAYGDVLKRGIELTAMAIRRVIADDDIDWDHILFR